MKDEFQAAIEAYLAKELGRRMLLSILARNLDPLAMAEQRNLVQQAGLTEHFTAYLQTLTSDTTWISNAWAEPIPMSAEMWNARERWLWDVKARETHQASARRNTNISSGERYQPMSNGYFRNIIGSDSNSKIALAQSKQVLDISAYIQDVVALHIPAPARRVMSKAPPSKLTKLTEAARSAYT